MRIVFMGTPEFAVPSLDALIRNGYEVVLVVTQKDKPRDRGKEIKEPPVKAFALAEGIPVLQPERLSRQPEMVEAIREVRPDLIVTCAFGQFLPTSLLQIPPRGTINVHASLLPALRGAAPIQWALINGERITGITTMMTDKGMDTGDMLLKEMVDITDDMTSGELHDMLSVVGAATLIKTIHMMESGKLVREPQNDALATLAPRLTKETGHIHWERSARDIHNLVRGTDPWPGAYTHLNKQKIRILETSLVPPGETPSEESLPTDASPGTILHAGSDGLLVQTGHGQLKVLAVQTPSSRRMAVGDWLNGHPLKTGTRLGEAE